ncbi:MAG: hypothetical protein V4689_18635 [Verrucomicrobiota bacterium]
MSPTLQKIFMLQRHQLIRWGSFGGYLSTGLGVLLIIASIPGFLVLDSQLKSLDALLEEMIKRERQVIESRESLDELKTFAIKASENRRSDSRQLIEMSRNAIQVSVFWLALIGMLLFSLGILLLRTKELAVEANSNRK